MKLHIKDVNVTATLKKLEKHLQVSGMLRSIGNIALAAVSRNFISGGRTKSGGVHAWQPLAESTLLMRRSGGKSKSGQGGAAPLQDTRALMNGIHGEYAGNKIKIATAGQPYAAIHQFGGTTRPRVTMKMIAFMWEKYTETRADMFANIASKARGTKLTVKLPARPYLMLTDPDRAEIKDFVLRFKPEGA
jgi:phage gpG-like protein